MTSSPRRVYYCHHNDLSIEIEILLDHVSIDHFQEGYRRELPAPIVRVSFARRGGLLILLEWGTHFVREHGRKVRSVILSHLWTLTVDCDSCRLGPLYWNRWIDEAKKEARDHDVRN